MSHYQVVRTKMKKTSALVTALMKMGFSEMNIEVSETLMPLKGYQGDKRKQQAHVRIKGAGWGSQNAVGSASNDLGWERLQNGEYQFHVSDFDRKKYGVEWQRKLSQQYSVAVIKEDVCQQGWETESEEVEANETIHLVLNIPYLN